MLKKCLFPVAGYGTRFLPATKAMPKEMLPVLNKPLVQYGVEEAVEAGLSEVCFVTGRGKRAIEDHFDRSYELEHQLEGSPREDGLESIRDLMRKCTFAYIRQVDVLGLGDAVLTSRPIMANEPFGVVLADDLCFGFESGVLSQMVQLYEKYQCSIVAVEEVPRESVSRYGIVHGHPVEPNVYRVDSLVEKPSTYDSDEPPLGVIGRYILTPDIFDELEHTPPGIHGEVQLTDGSKSSGELDRCTCVLLSWNPIRLRICGRICRGQQLLSSAPQVRL